MTQSQATANDGEHKKSCQLPVLRQFVESESSPSVKENKNVIIEYMTRNSGSEKNFKDLEYSRKLKIISDFIDWFKLRTHLKDEISYLNYYYHEKIVASGVPLDFYNFDAFVKIRKLDRSESMVRIDDLEKIQFIRKPKIEIISETIRPDKVAEVATVWTATNLKKLEETILTTSNHFHSLFGIPVEARRKLFQSLLLKFVENPFIGELRVSGGFKKGGEGLFVGMGNDGDFIQLLKEKKVQRFVLEDLTSVGFFKVHPETLTGKRFNQLMSPFGKADKISFPFPDTQTIIRPSLFSQKAQDALYETLENSKLKIQVTWNNVSSEYGQSYAVGILKLHREQISKIKIDNQMIDLNSIDRIDIPMSLKDANSSVYPNPIRLLPVHKPSLEWKSFFRNAKSVKSFDEFLIDHEKMKGYFYFPNEKNSGEHLTQIILDAKKQKILERAIEKITSLILVQEGVNYKRFHQGILKGEGELVMFVDQLNKADPLFEMFISDELNGFKNVHIIFGAYSSVFNPFWSTREAVETLNKVSARKGRSPAIDKSIDLDVEENDDFLQLVTEVLKNPGVFRLIIPPEMHIKANDLF